MYNMHVLNETTSQHVDDDNLPLLYPPATNTSPSLITAQVQSDRGDGKSTT